MSQSLINNFSKRSGCEIAKISSDHANWTNLVTKNSRITFHLAEEVVLLGEALGSCNKLPDKNWFTVTSDMPIGTLSLLSAFINRGLITWDPHKRRCRFPDDWARRYVKGIWLEHYCWLVLNRIRQEFHGEMEFAVDLECVWDTPHGQYKNQLDAAIITRDRLLFIECKTVNYPKFPETAIDDIYKIKAVTTNLDSINCDAVLLSVKEVQQAASARADGYGIKVVTASSIKYLDSIVWRWLNAVPA